MSKSSYNLPKMSRITHLSGKIENFGNLTGVKHLTNSLPVLVSCNASWCRPIWFLVASLSFQRPGLPKGSSSKTRHLAPVSVMLFGSCDLFSNRDPACQRATRLSSLSARANYFLKKVQFWKTGKKKIICLWDGLSVHLPFRASCGLYFNL